MFWAFPLTRIHAHAQAAAEEAETTAAQGRFWEMHDCLFEAHRKLEGADLERCAGEVCLDVGRFEREMEEHVLLRRTVFHDGYHDFETLLAVLEAAGEAGRKRTGSVG